VRKRLADFAGTVRRLIGHSLKQQCPKCGKHMFVSGAAGGNCWACGYIKWINTPITEALNRKVNYENSSW